MPPVTVKAPEGCTDASDDVGIEVSGQGCPSLSDLRVVLDEVQGEDHRFDFAVNVEGPLTDPPDLFADDGTRLVALGTHRGDERSGPGNGLLDLR